MPADAHFAAVQAALAAWVRDPALPVPYGIEPRRLAVYRELFFNNVRDFVESAFPVLMSLLPPDEWEALVADFFREHRAQSPYFRDISLAFRQWLEQARAPWLAARPWAAELLHYEWAGLAADCADVPAAPAHDPAGDLLAGVPVLAPAAWVLAYRWPVHRLGPQAPPETAPAAPTCLLLWRDEAGQVQEREVPPPAARLVEMLQQQPATGATLLQALAVESGLAPEQVPPFVSAGAGLLRELRAAGLILGVRCDNAAPA